MSKMNKDDGLTCLTYEWSHCRPVKSMLLCTYIVKRGDFAYSRYINSHVHRMLRQIKFTIQLFILLHQVLMVIVCELCKYYLPTSASRLKNCEIQKGLESIKRIEIPHVDLYSVELV